MRMVLFCSKINFGENILNVGNSIIGTQDLHHKNTHFIRLTLSSSRAIERSYLLVLICWNAWIAKNLSKIREGYVRERFILREGGFSPSKKKCSKNWGAGLLRGSLCPTFDVYNQLLANTDSSVLLAPLIELLQCRGG